MKQTGEQLSAALRSSACGAIYPVTERSGSQPCKRCASLAAQPLSATASQAELRPVVSRERTDDKITVPGPLASEPVRYVSMADS